MLSKVSAIFFIFSTAFAFAGGKGLWNPVHDTTLELTEREAKQNLYVFFFPTEMNPATHQFDMKKLPFKITAISESDNYMGFKLIPFTNLYNSIDTNSYNLLCHYINNLAKEAFNSINEHSMLIAQKSVDRIPLPWIPLPFYVVPNHRGDVEYIIGNNYQYNGDGHHTGHGKERIHIQFNQWTDDLEEYSSQIDWTSYFTHELCSFDNLIPAE